VLLAEDGPSPLPARGRSAPGRPRRWPTGWSTACRAWRPSRPTCARWSSTAWTRIPPAGPRPATCWPTTARSSPPRAGCLGLGLGL